jgi:hypothetical protein
LNPGFEKHKTLAPNDQTTFVKGKAEYISFEQVYIADENERFLCGMAHYIRRVYNAGEFYGEKRWRGRGEVNSQAVTSCR